MKLRFNGSFLGLNNTPYEFDTFDQAKVFIENYIERHSIDEEENEILLIDLKHGRSYVPFYQLINNEWVEVEYCNYDKCGLHPISDLHIHTHERNHELLCGSHYEMMEE